MRLLCVDPGTTHSGVLGLDSEDYRVIFAKADYDNKSLLEHIETRVYTSYDHMAIEGIQNMGMSAVGQTVFETAEWIGILRQAFGLQKSTKIYRNEEKICICNNMRAKSANIRQALIDMFEPSGGGKIPQVGTKNQPGPLYGLSSHAWSALAIGITYLAKVEGRI